MARVFVSHSSRDRELTERMQEWLREQGFTAPFLDFDKHSGIPPGADWERTLYREMERSEAVLILQTPNWLDSKWCFAEFTQARALGKPIFPIIEAATGEAQIAPDIQALDLRGDREGGLAQLARELTRVALDAQGGFGWDSRRPPYPGLLAFQEEDAAIYFGRDDEIRRLIERLNARRVQGGTKLIVLLGASGSGKSSLLRAGVIPRLKRDSRNWIVLPPMRPQRHPVDELARTLAIALGEGAQWRTWRDRLIGDQAASTLGDFANDLRARGGANEAQILISVDQSEELFSTSAPREAGDFFSIMSTVVTRQLPFFVLLTQRSDYLERLQSTAELSARFEEFSLGPLPLSRYPQIIEGPARIAGIEIESGLAQQASRDAETEDALPLLAFALRALYDQDSKHDRLSLSNYKSLGDSAAGLTPLENAVRKAADAVLEELRPTELELDALRDAFVPAMVRVNEKGEFTRRPARWNELPATAFPILERLAEARLLTVRMEGDARVIEVAHEALLRKWPRLRNWLDEAREFLLGRQQLERDLNDWVRAPDADKSGALLSGPKLSRARAWLTERAHQLTAEERAFITESINRADAEAREREARQRREIKRNRLITLGAGIAALVTTGLAVLAVIQWTKATENLEMAKASRLAAAAQVDQSHLLFFPRRSLLIATESLKRTASFEADQAIRKALALTPRPRGSILLDGEVESVAFSEAGGAFAVLYQGQSTIHVREVDSGKTLGELRYDAPVRSLALNPDGSMLAVIPSDGSSRIDIWNVRDATKLHSFPRAPGDSAIEFSRDGKRLYVKDEKERPNGSLLVGDSSDREARPEERQQLPAMDAEAVSSDGAYVARYNERRQIELIDVKKSQVIVQLQNYYGPRSSSFAPNGRFFLMTEYDGPSGQEIRRVWRLDDGDNARLAMEIVRIIRVEGEPRLTDVSVVGNGTRLLGLEKSKNGVKLRSWDIVGSEVPLAPEAGNRKADKITEEGLKQLAQRVAKVWPGDVPRPGRLSDLSQISRFAFTPDGRYLATIDLENLQVVHIWDLPLGREIARTNGASELDGVLFDGAYLITQSGADKQSWLWRHEDMWKEACRRLTRNFSQGEWFQFLPDEPYRETCPGLPIPSKVEEENSQA